MVDPIGKAPLVSASDDKLHIAMYPNEKYPINDKYFTRCAKNATKASPAEAAEREECQACHAPRVH